ncbi:MAG: 1-acyl-sn-glycerol-3-phosphate acyltransferase [Actinobacteria bacterium]|nr:1-acyl-sn-glycerol-3-phosphate acyltransferase [Actinomycetota bacterium]MBW3650952.1 1-acyl-sn-glycerol-3-phosphate acyltransferase [Actinomycetota bacterium]
MAYWILKYLAALPLRFCFRIRVEGLEHVPGGGGAILAGNHLAVFDSFFVPLVVRRRITFAAKAEYFENPRTAWFFRAVGQIPIKRSGGSASQRALEAAKGVLEDGRLFGIYPEGTRSPDGRLYKGHTGVARLALECKVPVLVVACIGTREAQPIGRRIPRLFMPITIRISRPLDFSRYHGCEDDPLVLRKITDEIMYELRELSGQEYVDTYATRTAGGSEAPPTRVAVLPDGSASTLERTAAMAAS